MSARWKATDINDTGGVISVQSLRVKKINSYIVFIEEGLKRAGISFTKEFRFHVKRKWRFDFVIGGTEAEINHQKIAIEFNGGMFMLGKGAHNKMGALRDMEKLNYAQLAGFRVLQYHSKDLNGKDCIGVHGIVQHVRQLMR